MNKITTINYIIFLIFNKPYVLCINGMMISIVYIVNDNLIITNVDNEKLNLSY